MRLMASQQSPKPNRRFRSGKSHLPFFECNPQTNTHSHHTNVVIEVAIAQLFRRQNVLYIRLNQLQNEILIKRANLKSHK